MRAVFITSISLFLALSSMAVADTMQSGLVDPTQPKNYRAAPRSAGETIDRQAFSLNFVSLGQEPRAVINGHRVKQGDWVDGAKVLKISASGVVLRTDFGQEKLSIKPKQSIKTVRP